MGKMSSNMESELKLESLVEVLTMQLRSGRVETKLAVLRWIYHLFNISRPKMVNFVDQIFPVLLKTLSDSSDEVLILNLQVLAEICCPPTKHSTGSDNNLSDKTKKDAKKNELLKENPNTSLQLPSTFGNTNPHFNSFILSLLKLFRADRNLLDTKGSFNFRQLCMLLSAEDIYRSLAELLLQESNLKFARLMVETLNTILLTTSELFDLRNRLRNLSSQESCELFTSLYRTWSHNPIATIALCLLTGCYRHAGDLVRVISDQEVTLEMLTELDRLVQLIESPIFTYLRMELLDDETNNDLLHALQALLMLLPQSNAFRILRDRLNCLQRVSPNFDRTHSNSPAKINKSARQTPKANGIIAFRIASEEIDFHALLDHFKSVQQNHLDLLRAQSQEQQLTRGVKILDLSDSEEDEDHEDSDETNKYSL